MRERALVTAVALAVVLVALVPLRGAFAGGNDGPPDFDARHSDLDPDGARSFRGFPLYSLGDEHAGLPLTAITRRRDGGPGHRAEYVAFLYGTCTPRGDAGCPLPLEVQVWPACRRTRAHYRLTPFSDQPLPHERLTARGVPAAFFPESARFARLELFTGRVTVVLFGRERAQLVSAAASLRGVNVDAPAGTRLPAPAAGATDGRLRCDDG